MCRRLVPKTVEQPGCCKDGNSAETASGARSYLKFLVPFSLVVFDFFANKGLQTVFWGFQGESKWFAVFFSFCVLLLFCRGFLQLYIVFFISLCFECMFSDFLKDRR